MMRKVLTGNRVVLVFQVEKMRGLSHDNQQRPYKIDKGGLVVYPKEKVL